MILSKVEIDRKQNYSHLLYCGPDDAFNVGFENVTSPWASGLRHLYLLWSMIKNLPAELGHLYTAGER